MTKPQKEDILEIDITDISSEGQGIGRTGEDFVVFVKNSVPGDRVRVKVRKVKKQYADANLIQIIRNSAARTEPLCEYFGTCNGCKMQNITYSYQLELKRSSVKSAFERIGGFVNIEVPEVLGSQNNYYYRNKMEFSFSNQRWLTELDLEDTKVHKNFALGFHMPGFIDKVIDISKCHLQSELSNKILNLTRSFFESKDESAYTTKTHSGFLRYLIIRQSVFTADIMINLITHTERHELIKEYFKLLQDEVPEITTFVNSISKSKAQVAQSDYSITVHGKGFITEKIGNYLFKITPSSFFQTNSTQAKTLFDTIIGLGSFSGEESVIDLYCGTGAISVYISGYVKNVLGVEMHNEAIEMAKENAKLNNVKNCKFAASDVKDFLHQLTTQGISEPRHHLPERTGGNYNCIILDPPRSGMHPKSAAYIMELEPEKIIYVSCNPATQARDVKLLSEKYKISGMQPVDMFPHTFHIENVVRLDRRK